MLMWLCVANEQEKGQDAVRIRSLQKRPAKKKNHSDTRTTLGTTAKDHVHVRGK